jgi:predicted nucleic acid-binding protein
VKVAFDTSVWVEHLRGGGVADLIDVMRRRCVLQMDAVVAAELRAGCRSRRQERLVESLIAPFARARRVVTPVEGDFARAALALARLRASGLTLGRPAGVLMDGLIAAVAVRTGALLVTSDVDDFRMLATRMPLRVEGLDALAARFRGAS